VPAPSLCDGSRSRRSLRAVIRRSRDGSCRRTDWRLRKSVRMFRPTMQEAPLSVVKELHVRSTSLVLFLALFAGVFPSPVRAEGPVTGYTAHFTHLHSVADAHRILREARAAGARLLNVVPPARI